MYPPSQHRCVIQTPVASFSTRDAWCSDNFPIMTTTRRHVNNGYPSVSHFGCLECELTPEKIGAWSRVPDPSKNERASPHDLAEFNASACHVERRHFDDSSLCRDTRPYPDQQRQGHGLRSIRRYKPPMRSPDLGRHGTWVGRSCFPT
jgi:hypothetical protein